MKKLENLYNQNLLKMKTTLEEKLENAATALEEQQTERQRRISGYVMSILLKLETYNPMFQQPRAAKSEKREDSQNEKRAGRWTRKMGQAGPGSSG